MKKNWPQIAMLCLCVVLMLAGCNDTEQITTYTFRGEHDYFAISNGSITLSDTEEVFDGGDLQITQSGVFEEVASYSTTFYMIADGERRIILSNSVVDQTGGPIGNKVEKIDNLKENLWFELKTTDLNGNEEAYQVQLTLTE